MIKANLKKNIIEFSGNNMDYLSELMALAWELQEEYPELRELMKESFDTVMKAKERPAFESEEKFTRDMRELLGAMNEPEEPAPLDEEDMMYLLHKAMTVRGTNNEVHCDFRSSGRVVVWFFYKDSTGKSQVEKEFDLNFYLYESGRKAEESREKYNRCIAYLEKLAGEEDDN